MSVSACVSDSMLRAVVDDALAEEARLQAVAHMETCARCRARMSELLARDAPAPTKPSAAPDLHKEGVTIAQRYLLGKVLGRGGMGVVHDAVQLDLGRAVAVKLLPPSADPTASSRFAREARTLAQLAHPNIVQIFDYGTIDGGTAYVVMERLDGRPLSDALRTEGPFGIGRAAWVASDTLRALAVSHEAGIVHRDIKPANIFVLPNDGVKLLDFGIASTNDGSRLTMTGTALGTPAYMAPEQVLAGKVDGRTDLYAVGVCLFEMLTGQKPFPGRSATSLVVDIVEGGPPRVDRVRPDIPAPVADIIERAMARDPAGRFADAATFAHALAPWVRFAPRPGSSRRSSRLGIFLGGSAAVILISMSIAGFMALPSSKDSAAAVATAAVSNDAGAAREAESTPPAPPVTSSSTLAGPGPTGKAADGGIATSSASCTCTANGSRKAMCVKPRTPDCACSASDGALLCPTPWDAATSRCAGGTGAHAYSAPGRRNGESCSGFKATSSASSVGKLDCAFCDGLGDRVVGVAGAPCRGLTDASIGPDDLRDGTFVCK